VPAGTSEQIHRAIQRVCVQDLSVGVGPAAAAILVEEGLAEAVGVVEAGAFVAGTFEGSPAQDRGSEAQSDWLVWTGAGSRGPWAPPAWAPQASFHSREGRGVVVLPLGPPRCVVAFLPAPVDASDQCGWQALGAVLRAQGGRGRAAQAESARQVAVRDRAHLERVFEHAPAVIAIHRGPDHVFTFANQAFRASSDGRQLVGRPYADAFPEFVDQGYVEIFDRVYQTGQPFTAVGVRADTARFVGGPAGERYWNLVFQPTLDADGAIDGLISFAFEVTDHVLAMRGAQRERQRYDDLVRAIGAMAWTVDPAGWLPTWVGGEVQAVLGCAPADAMATGAWWDPVHPADRAGLRAARASLRADGDSYRADFRLPATSTSWRWVSESGRLAVVDAAGLPVTETEASSSAEGLVRRVVRGLTQDVTALHRAQEEQEELQAQLLHVQKLESLGLLAGGIAHDFNNLLTVILGNATLAEDLLPPQSPAHRALGALVLAADRASELTRQLLAYSGRGHSRIEVLDLRRQIDELGALLGASLPKKVQLRIEVGGTVPPIEADVAQVQQVLMNLVINGADAIGPEGGTVVVRVGVQELSEGDLRGAVGFGEARAGRFAWVEVSDDGAGMDPATLGRIFDPFFSTKATGRGLGLAAVQGIIRGHQGLVRVYSELGQGTTFKVFFPVSLGRLAPLVEPSPIEGRGSATVLVVDDEPTIREIARAILEGRGYRVIEAGDGQEAVDVFRSRSAEIDLVLLDMTMPRLSGEEAYRELVLIRPDIRVILSSGYNEVEATRRLVGQGQVAFIQKPYTVRQLMAAVVAAQQVAGGD